MRRAFSSLALALMAALSASAQVQPDLPEEWQKAGITEADARRWIAAGIPFARWARQWKDEGFAPAEARFWVDRQINVYTAGGFRNAGFSSTGATEWIATGVRSAKRAMEFRDAGFTPAEAGAWWRLEFFPDDAAEWRRAGFSPPEALAWKYGEKALRYSGSFRSHSRALFSPEWAGEWRGAGFALDVARRANLYGVELREANEWRSAGFAFDEAMFWRDFGFSPASAVPAKRAGLTALEAAERERAARGAVSDEIQFLHIDAALRPDATIDVTETIELVNRAGGEVGECFRRSFPAAVPLPQSDAGGHAGWPSYTLVSVRHDGRAATYRIDRDWSGDFTLCIGPKDARLAERVHTFEIAYTTDDRVTGYYDHDRLSMAVKEPWMPLRVNRAAATVRLPRGANTVEADGFAGPPRRKYFTATVEETSAGDSIAYAATRPLTSDMTFHAIVTLPKGFARPGAWQRVRRFDRAEGRILLSSSIFLAGVLLSLAYFAIVWRKVGRDPERAAVVPAYQPPGSLSPASMRYLVVRRSVDARAVVATIVRLAQAGALAISERDGRYRLEKRAARLDTCSPHEAEFFVLLFGRAHALHLGTKDARRRLGAARRALRKALRAERAGYVRTNRRYFWPGLAMSTAGMLAAVVLVDPLRNDAGLVAALVMTAVLAAVNATFWSLLKAPTAAAQKLFEDIQGFRQFLEMSYRDGVTAHLPYAIALGVDDDRVSLLDGEHTWYAGSSGGFSAGDLGASLRRLTPGTVSA